MINNLQRAVVLERLTIEVEADDPDDSFLLAMALAGDADYLVTGDRRAGLLQRGHIERTRIVTPAVFCAEISALNRMLVSNTTRISAYVPSRALRQPLRSALPRSDGH